MRENMHNLKELKEHYEKVRSEYELPKFSELSQIFDIEEIDSDTDFLLRKIRKVASEKIENYLRFVETILNPNAAPLFFFKLIKKLDNVDREGLTKIYETLGGLVIEIISLDLSYSEKEEAEFIKKSFRIFDEEIKKEFLEFVRKMINEEDNDKKVGESSYCG